MTGHLYMIRMEIVERVTLRTWQVQASPSMHRECEQGRQQMEGDREQKKVCNTSWTCRAEACEVSGALGLIISCILFIFCCSIYVLH